MSGIYDRVASRPGGEVALAAARLRREVLVVLRQAFEASGLHSQSEVARRLNVRRSAVNQVFRGDGNLRVNAMAEYLFALGFEVDLTMVVAGEPRRAALEGRPTLPAWNTSYTSVLVIGLPENRELWGWGAVNTMNSIPSVNVKPIVLWISPPSAPYGALDPTPESTSRTIIGELVREGINET